MLEMKACFQWIPLGVEGGLLEGNLSAHLVAPVGSADFVCLDAGTLLDGLRVAAANGCFPQIHPAAGGPLGLEGTVLLHHIKAYLISHTYLDHISGLVLISPNDSPKPILALPDTIEGIRRHLFNWACWPNFARTGEAPRLNVYQYVPLPPGEKEPVPGTAFTVEAHPLAHGAHIDSAAFLLESGGEYLLYMGDTGPDEVEGRRTTEALWERIAPLIRERRLHAISIEASYVNERSDSELFSHLTPAWLMCAFHKLAEAVSPGDPDRALEGLPVIITHIKPDLTSDPPPRQTIRAQLEEANDLGLRLLFARQGEPLEL